MYKTAAPASLIRGVLSKALKGFNTAGRVAGKAMFPLAMGASIVPALLENPGPEDNFKYANALNTEKQGGNSMDKVAMFNKLAEDIEVVGSLAEALETYAKANYPEELVKQASAEAGEPMIVAEDLLSAAGELLKVAQAMMVEDYNASLEDEKAREESQIKEAQAAEVDKVDTPKFSKLAEFIEHKKYAQKFDTKE